MVQAAVLKKTSKIVTADQYIAGFVMPPEVMISFHAMTATGFWNQIYKPGQHREGKILGI